MKKYDGLIFDILMTYPHSEKLEIMLERFRSWLMDYLEFCDYKLNNEVVMV